MSIIKDAIEFMISTRRESVIKTKGKEYVLDGYREISKKDPIAPVLQIKTLTGLVSYIKHGLDNIPDGSFIHVSDYNCVKFISPVFGTEKQRESFIIAEFNDDAFNDNWCNTEQFIINVNSMFAHTCDYGYLMKFASVLTSEASKKVEDNGVSQKTVVQVGITTSEEIETRNPITLQPFRTFPEIKQPEIDYVFRLKEVRDNRTETGPLCALFECDGGMWKLNTVHAIRDYLESELTDSGVKIIA